MGEGQQRKGSSGELSRRGNLSATAPAHSRHKNRTRVRVWGMRGRAPGRRGCPSPNGTCDVHDASAATSRVVPWSQASGASSDEGRRRRRRLLLFHHLE